MASLTTLTVSWSGSTFQIDVNKVPTVGALKQWLAQETNVPTARQKIIGIKRSCDDDSVELNSLGLKPGAKLILMGQPDEVVNKLNADAELVDNSALVDDTEIKLDDIPIHEREEFLAKIQRRISTCEIVVLNSPRPNKKLLVLDIDYTLFDHKSCAESGLELMRPYLHEFLTEIYEYYDIAIWSTSMKWINAKLAEMKLLTSEFFKISFCLESLHMIQVYTTKRGLVDVKPLAVIWGKFPEHYSSKNSLHIDDVSHNFLMNIANGLKIKPYKNAHINRSQDKELQQLSKYLVAIAQQEDLSQMDHNAWKKFHR